MKNKAAEFLPAPSNDDVFYTVPDESEEELTAAEKAAAAAVEQLSSNAEKGKTIRIYRQLGSGQESMEFVAKYPADKFTIDDLIDKMQVEYGGGDYRFMIYNEKGKLAANKLICIARKQKLNSRDSNNGMFELLQAVMEKQDNFARLIMNKQNEGNTSRTELLQEMVIMKNLFSAGESKTDTFAQVKELMETMNLIKDMGGEPEASDNFGSIIRESIPLLQTIAENVNAPVQPNLKPKPTGENMKSLAIRHLLKMCGNGELPKVVAQVIIDELPGKYISQIEEIILSENPIDKMVEINPQVMNHGEWFIDVIECLKYLLGHDSKYGEDGELTGDNDKTIIPDNGTSDSKNIIDS